MQPKCKKKWKFKAFTFFNSNGTCTQFKAYNDPFMLPRITNDVKPSSLSCINVTPQRCNAHFHKSHTQNKRIFNFFHTPCHFKFQVDLLSIQQNESKLNENPFLGMCLGPKIYFFSNTFFTYFIFMLVDRGKKWDNYKMKLIISKGGR